MLSICFLQRGWVLGLMDKGWTAGDKGCAEQEPAMMSLLHNTGWFSLGFYNNSSTRYIQQRRQVLWLEVFCLFPFPPHLRPVGKGRPPAPGHTFVFTL